MMSPILTERMKQPWEEDFRKRLHDLLAQRLTPIASEIGTLQSTFNAVCERLVNQAKAPVAGEVDDLENHFRQLVSDFEMAHRSESDVLRDELSRQGEDLAKRAGDTAAINASIAEIDRQRSQGDTLTALLDSTVRFSDRAAIFITRQDDLVGWKVRGFVEHEADQNESLSKLRERILPHLEESVRRMATVSPEASNGQASAIIPLVIRNKASAVLYAEGDSHPRLDVHALEALMLATSMAIELLPVHRSFERASRRTKSIHSQQPETTEPLTEELEEHHEQHHEQHLLKAASAPEPEPAPVDLERAHSDARRFARFLISEIKLYNPAKVYEGLRKSDLYERLRDEIEMRRTIYDRHVESIVTAEFDYFYDELVMNLADGDSDKLGTGASI